MIENPNSTFCPLQNYKDRCRFLEESIYALLIGQRFKSVYIFRNGETLDAFMVPDNKGREFMLFLLDELPDLLRRYGIEFQGVTPHSVKNTKAYYPEIYNARFRVGAKKK